MSIWCERALVGGELVHGVRLDTTADGRIAALTVGGWRRGGDVALGTVVPGFADAHSHLFHRALRGRTHADGGDFWRWREAMYAVAGTLEPDTYRRLAVAVFTEMLASGYTAVGEFHYVHHRPDGRRYPAHAMELALADAAEEAGIRLVLLDTCYLSGGFGRPLEPAQERFGDGSAHAWLDRWHALHEALAERSHLVTLGAAVHSVRAVPPDAIRVLLDGLPARVPVHVHLSEQPRENTDCLAAHGVTPTGLLDRVGALGERLTVVHATHLTAADRMLLGDARVGVVLCPTTEADLGDGIGPARALADAGARLAIGSDQNAVIDPLLELRGLEAGERLARQARGVLAPDALWAAGGRGGYAALGLDGPGDGATGPGDGATGPVDGATGPGDGPPGPGLRVGDWCDLVELDAASARTVGSADLQLVLTATAADVLTTVVGGSVVTGADPAALLAQVLPGLGRPASVAARGPRTHEERA